MSAAQTLSDTKAQTASRLRLYQTLLGISLAVNVAIAVFGILDPVGLGHLLLQADPYPPAGPRIWCATLLGLQLVCVPGLRNPLFHRWPNWSMIAFNLFMTMIFLTAGRSLYVLAALSFFFFVVLLVAYYRLMMADLLGKP